MFLCHLRKAKPLVHLCNRNRHASVTLASATVDYPTSQTVSTLDSKNVYEYPRQLESLPAPDALVDLVP